MRRLRSALLASSTIICVLSCGAAAAQSNAPAPDATAPATPAKNPPTNTAPAGAAPAAGTGVLDTIVVTTYAREEQQIGIAHGASEGAVGGADLTTRPILRVAELLEVVPGLISAQHSGSGKAQQYFLRGINLDHGTDFTNYFDDVPMNFRTHGHGQGYLDLNGIIPETIQRVDYRKGPYRADVGDFALAGVSYMTTVEAYDRPFATAEIGSFGWKRFVTGGTFPVLAGTVTGAVQIKTYNGPWQLPEDLQHISTYSRYSQVTSFGMLDASLSFYNGKWQPTEQIPDRAIGHTFTGEGHSIDCKDAFCAIDPTARGKTTRFIGSARLTGDNWRATLYGQFYDWHMSSNPTFFLEDPVNGDQIYQHDKRWIIGGRGEQTVELFPSVEMKYGMEWRYDDIVGTGVDHTIANRLLSVIANNSVREASASPYSEVTWNPIKGLRVMGGLRFDAYNFDVKALDPGSSSGNVTAHVFSPKAGIAYQITDYLELYGSWGQGFHSNDGRGVVNTTTPVAPLSKGTGKEGGARLQIGSFNFTAAYWWLDSTSELKFVGDSNSVEPGPASARSGYELTSFYRPYDWLAIDASWTGTNAKYLNSPGAEHIPGALDNVGELGISSVFEEWEASTRFRYVGGYPLIEDNSARATPDYELNFRVAWKPGRYTIYAELLNALNHDGKDIEYFYTTRLPGEALGGVDGTLSRSEEPRTIRVGLKVTL